MNRSRFRPKSHAPSLVPLADMLTNTVGIMIFILIFTVLAAGGVVVAKRLPLERATDAQPLHVLCAGGRLLPLHDTLIDRFLDPLGRLSSHSEVDSWLQRYNARQVEDEFFLAQGKGTARKSWNSASLDLTISFIPREGMGDTIENLQLAGSRFRQLLHTHQPQQRFIYFHVRPDGLNSFSAARTLALEKGFSTGWTPLAADDPVRFCLIKGCGRDANID